MCERVFDHKQEDEAGLPAEELHTSDGVIAAFYSGAITAAAFEELTEPTDPESVRLIVGEQQEPFRSDEEVHPESYKRVMGSSSDGIGNGAHTYNVDYLKAGSQPRVFRGSWTNSDGRPLPVGRARGIWKGRVRKASDQEKQ